MVYSRWRPSGGFDYYATGESRPIGVDLPTPRFSQVSPIGVPSTEIGRSLPAAARHVGAGPLARGQVAPMQPVSGLGALSIGMTELGLFAIATLFGWWLRGALAREMRA